MIHSMGILRCRRSMIHRCIMIMNDNTSLKTSDDGAIATIFHVFSLVLEQEPCARTSKLHCGFVD